MVNCEILIVKQHAMVSFVIVDQVSINKKRHLQIKCSENRFNCEPNHERGALRNYPVAARNRRSHSRLLSVQLPNEGHSNIVFPNSLSSPTHFDNEGIFHYDTTNYV